MNHLEITNLEKYQHYKDRHMVWFKWYIDCLQDYKFMQLEPKTRWDFVGLVCLACKCNNEVTADFAYLNRTLNTKNIDKSIDILSDSGLLAKCYTHKIREEKIREEKIREEKIRGEITKFVIPTSTEVEDYGNSIAFKINGDQFCSYYASKGWLIGKSPMKDWRAAVRTWKIKDNSDKPQKAVPTHRLVKLVCSNCNREINTRILVNQDICGLECKDCGRKALQELI